MIVILTNSSNELTTDRVMDCLVHFGVDHYRLNVDEFFDEIDYIEPLSIKTAFVTKFNTDKILFWYRRRGTPSISLYSDGRICRQAHNQIKIEYNTAIDFILTAIEDHFPIVDRSSAVKRNKLQNLYAAAQVGLKVPKAIISAKPDQIRSFMSLNQIEVITKPIFEILNRSTLGGRLYHFFDNTSLAICRSNDTSAYIRFNFWFSASNSFRRFI